MTKEIEFSKDLIATVTRNSKPVAITLTAIEVFAIVSAVQFARGEIPESGSLGELALKTAKKMHDCLDPNSLLSLQLNKGWDLEKFGILSQHHSSLTEDFPLEGFMR
jgi:hypothetical protein